MKTQKGFIVPLIIAIVVIVAGGAVFYVTRHFQLVSEPVSKSSADSSVNTGTSSHDGQDIENVIFAFLRASRNVTTDAGADAVLATYYTPEAEAHAKIAVSTIVPDPGVQSVLVQESQAMPDPSVLKYSSIHIVDTEATATYRFAAGSSLVVNLQKIEDRWLISNVSFEVK